MLALALLSPTVIVLAFVWLYDRERSRATGAMAVAADRALAGLRVQAHAVEVIAAASKQQADHTDDMVRRHALHIDRLVQRIQAPEIAVAAQAAVDLDGVPEQQYVPPDDDQAWQANRETAFSGQAVDPDAVDWRDFLADRANA